MRPVSRSWKRERTEPLRNFGTDKCVPPAGVDNKDEIGEAVNKAAGELLFLVKSFFDFALGGDIDQCALITEDFPAGIANCGGSMQADKG